MQPTTSQDVNPAAVEGGILPRFTFPLQHGVALAVSLGSSSFQCVLTMHDDQLYDKVMALPVMEKRQVYRRAYGEVQVRLPSYDDVLAVAALMRSHTGRSFGLPLFDAQVHAKLDKPTAEQIHAHDHLCALANTFLRQVQPHLPVFADTPEPVTLTRLFRGQALRTKTAYVQVRPDPHSARFVRLGNNGLTYQEYLTLRDHAADFFGEQGMYASV